MAKRIAALLVPSLLAAVVLINCQPATSLAQDAAKEKKAEAAPKEGDGRPIGDLKQFMRAKLAASNKVLEGLTTEDMAMVREGARALNKMSLSEKWRAHNDVMYKQFSSEFQRVTKDLAMAAEEENLDQAALKWMGATMACIECHRYVRSTLIVDLEKLK